jgi:hypothetical protein
LANHRKSEGEKFIQTTIDKGLAKGKTKKGKKTYEYGLARGLDETLTSIYGAGYRNQREALKEIGKVWSDMRMGGPVPERLKRLGETVRRDKDFREVGDRRDWLIAIGRDDASAIDRANLRVQGQRQEDINPTEVISGMSQYWLKNRPGLNSALVRGVQPTYREGVRDALAEAQFLIRGIRDLRGERAGRVGVAERPQGFAPYHRLGLKEKQLYEAENNRLIREFFQRVTEKIRDELAQPARPRG